MPPSVPEKVIARIKKCLALAASGSGATAGESEAAMRQARKLMDQYGITSDDVELSEICSSAVRVKAHGTQQWHAAIVACVSHLFGVACVFRHSLASSRGEVAFLGTEKSVELASYLYTVLMRQILADRAKFRKELRAELEKKCSYAPRTLISHYVSEQATAFCLGWAERVISRCCDLFVKQSAAVTRYVEREFSNAETLRTKSLSAERLQSGHYSGALRSGQIQGSKAIIHVGVVASAAGSPVRALRQ